MEAKQQHKHKKEQFEQASSSIRQDFSDTPFAKDYSKNCIRYA